VSFVDYFNYLAHRIFKKKSNPKDTDIYKLASALGPNYDEAKQVIFALREQALVATAYGNGLDQLGKDREMPRYRGEEDEEYRRRLLAAVNIYSEGGTKPGMQRVLSILGYTNSEVYPLYLEKYKWRFLDSWSLDGSNNLKALDPTAKLEYLGRWAEFLVKLNLGDAPFLETQYLVAREMINDVKPSEGKLYALQLTINAATVNRINLVDQVFINGYFGNEFRAGALLLDGRKDLCPSPLPLLLDGSFYIEGGELIDGEYGLADGTWLLSDTRMDSGVFLRQTAKSVPGKVLSLDGRYWLNGKVAVGGNKRPATGRSLINLKTSADARMRGQAMGIRLGVSTHSPHPVSFLNAFHHGMAGDRFLDSKWLISASKHIDDRFGLSSGTTRIKSKVTIAQSASFSPSVVFDLNGHHWLNGRAAIGNNKRLTSTRSRITSMATADIETSSQAPRVMVTAFTRSPHQLNRLDAFYYKLAGDRRLDNGWSLLASKLLSGGFGLSSGNIRNAVRSKVGTGVKSGKCWSLAGRWLLDGGGYRYLLNGFLKLSPRNWLDGTVLLSGGENLCYRSVLGEKNNMLNGRRFWGGEMLDGRRQLKAYPVSIGAGVTIKKDGRIIEQGVI